MKLWGYLSFIGLLLLVVVGCKSALERQDDAYNHNRELVAEFSQSAPGFKEFLEAGEKKAAAFYLEADKLDDEEARAAKMKEANNAFGPALAALRQYSSLDYEIKHKMERLDKIYATSHRVSSEKRTLWTETDRILEDAHKTISTLKPKNEGEGAAEVLRQVSRMQTLETRVSSVLERAEREQRKDRERRRKSKEKKKSSQTS